MVWFKSRSVDTDKQDKLYTRWEQDYNLADIPVLGLFDEYLEMGKILTCKRNRGSYMSAHVLLNLLNELGKRDKMRGLPSILSLFRNELNKFDNTRARMLDSIYHMTLRLL